MSVHGPFSGSANDKTMLASDPYAERVAAMGPMFNVDGKMVKPYIIVDGGYQDVAFLMSPSRSREDEPLRLW
eukprot:6614847-Prorocentrum_lima.AAC.1